MVYKRVLLKLSGEALSSGAAGSLDHEACRHIASCIVDMHKLGIEIGIVVGGGNIFRGNQAGLFGFKKTPADHIGMLATAINGITLSQMIASMGCPARVMSAVNLGSMVEPYNWRIAQSYIRKQKILIFVSGTGNPYFTTDTCAALRAAEMDADVVLKATKVDGVYDKDPKQHADAKIFKHLNYDQVLESRLNVMDATAVALCRENEIPIHVVNLFDKEALLGAAQGKDYGTIVTTQ